MMKSILMKMICRETMMNLAITNKLKKMTGTNLSSLHPKKLKNPTSNHTQIIASKLQKLKNKSTRKGLNSTTK